LRDAAGARERVIGQFEDVARRRAITVRNAAGAFPHEHPATLLTFGTASERPLASVGRFSG
jgi:hypothetical protein